jgi:tripartite-type tricarboxylate transporter receptor subunit TctC
MFRTIVFCEVAALLLAASAGSAWAQAGEAAYPSKYPRKPVRMVVPLAPGGGSDIVGRLVALALTEHWGQSVVVDNRPGAGSTIGTGIAAKAIPDGYTMLVSSSSIAISPALFKKLDFDIVRDFAGITLLASQPSILAVHPSVKAGTVRELVALMKERRGKLTYGSAGVGSASHLANELFTIVARAEAVHVPYKSAGLAATALLSGEVQFMVTNMATALPQVRAGKMKGLGVTSARRSAQAPDLPTIMEAGLPGYEYTTWYGMLAPAATPKAIVAKVHGDVTKLLQAAQLRERFAAQGLDVHGNSPAEFSAYLREEIARWGKVVGAAGIKPE